MQTEILQAIDAGLGTPFFAPHPLPKGAFSQSSLRWNMVRAQGMKRGNTPQTRAFSSGFSRAFKSLVERGYFVSVETPNGPNYFRKAKVKR